MKTTKPIIITLTREQINKITMLAAHFKDVDTFYLQEDKGELQIGCSLFLASPDIDTTVSI